MSQIDQYIKNDWKKFFSILSEIEIDTIKISEKCPKQCSHCSQDPKSAAICLPFEKFKDNLDAIIELQKNTSQDLFANYILTSTDSDPFLNDDLAKIMEYFYQQTGKCFYLLTSGWYDNTKFRANANRLARNPQIFEKIQLTLSNFPTRPDSIFEHAEIFINVIKTFGYLPKDKFIISPQYNAEVDDRHIHSYKQTKNLLEYTIKKAGFCLDDFDKQIFFRPIIGLGRASSILGVKHIETYRIEAETPAPNISDRENRRPYSAMLDLLGDIKILKSKRGELNRELREYKSISESIRNIG